jgi:Tol biopolymer transport system component
MNADPQLRDRLEHAARHVTVDVHRRLDRVHGSVARQARGRKVRAIAVAAAAAAVIAVVAWQLRPFGDDAVRTGGAISGGRIACLGSNGDARGLFQLDVDTAAVSQLTDGTAGVLAAQWSPDGSRLAYVIEESSPRSEEPGPRYAIVIANADGSDPETIVDEADTGAAGPDIIDVTWSPDGSRIAYSGRVVVDGVARRTILIVNADGSGGTTAIDGLWTSVDWSPDGERLLVEGFPGEGHEGQFDLYTISPDGSDLAQLTEDAAGEWASWSPDGTRIAFTSGDDDYHLDVFVMDADGSNRLRVTDWEGFDQSPAWSPDGAWIAFTSDRDATTEQQASNRSGEALFTGISLYAMHPDGTGVMRLLETESAVPVDWVS